MLKNAGVTSGALRCPKCRRRMNSRICDRCGSTIPAWQAHLYAVASRQVAATNGIDNDGDGGLGNTGTAPGQVDSDELDEAEDPLQNTQTPPSLCLWIFQRLADAGVHPQVILDPGAGTGNLTRPFRPGSKVIEYEIQRGTDFFAEAGKITCDLTICNPPWSWAEKWVRQIVRLVGRETPLVFFSPTLLFTGYKDGPVRKFFDSAEAPTLHHITPLPSDTFVGVYSSGSILWCNLPQVRDVAFVPNRHLIRRNEGVGEQVGIRKGGRAR